MKLALCIVALVLALTIVGFTGKIPKTYEMDKNPIKISKIEVQPFKDGKTEVRGSVTNTGKYDCNMCVRVTYNNFDGSTFYVQDIQIKDLYVGKTIYYANFINKDVRGYGYTVRFAHFFTYDK